MCTMDDVSSTVNDAAEAAVAAAGADESAAAAAAGEHKFQRGNKHGGVRQDNMSLSLVVCCVSRSLWLKRHLIVSVCVWVGD